MKPEKKPWGWVPLLIAVSLAATAAAAQEEHDAAEQEDLPRIIAPSIDPAASCKICHPDVVHVREQVEDSDEHEDVDCIECHVGRRFNPHLLPELEPDGISLVEQLGGYFEKSPDAIVGCEDCHDEEALAWQDSIHGAGAKTDDEVRRPSCADCHGVTHATTPASQRKREMAARCMVCHDFDPGENGPASPFVVATYRETVHGKMLALGNDDAAACADCHTGHEVYARDDPRSTIHPDKRAATCRSCHEDATASFTAAISHQPPTLDANFWAWFTTLAFSALTVGTILLLLLHVLVDLFYSARKALARRRDEEWSVETVRGGSQADIELPAADEEIQRFDGHARLQHAILMISFTTLVLTGWPLKSAAVGVSSRLVKALGGQATLAFAHRLAGAMLLGVSVYHLVYLAVRWRRGQLSTAVFPIWKDITDVVGNVLYLVGLRGDRPKFGSFTYYEKFDYWAVFWGMAIMGTSGIVLWFPELAARVLPGEFIVLCFIAHSDEALLAALAIFLWHFYNVHLRPSVFPMSWVWLTGRITASAMHEEHRIEYEERYGARPPRAPRRAPGWYEHPAWSFGALGTVLVVSGIVLALDVASVRSEIAALEPHPGPYQSETQEIDTSGLVAASDEGFDAWATCVDCHNQKRMDSEEAAFPHALHFEDDEVEDDCSTCHESPFHQVLQTQWEDCLDCHEPDEIRLPESDSAVLWRPGTTAEPALAAWTHRQAR
jgi:cytochrome b subunit of formate dehydrogenase